MKNALYKPVLTIKQQLLTTLRFTVAVESSIVNHVSNYKLLGGRSNEQVEDF